jgi:hypothetical protein
LVFHAYINEMHGSRSKIPSKISRQQRCAEGFNSGVKGVRSYAWTNLVINSKSENNYSIGALRLKIRSFKCYGIPFWNLNTKLETELGQTLRRKLCSPMYEQKASWRNTVELFSILMGRSQCRVSFRCSTKTRKRTRDGKIMILRETGLNRSTVMDCVSSTYCNISCNIKVDASEAACLY